MLCFPLSDPLLCPSVHPLWNMHLRGTLGALGSGLCLWGQGERNLEKMDGQSASYEKSSRLQPCGPALGSHDTLTGSVNN